MKNIYEMQVEFIGSQTDYVATEEFVLAETEEEVCDYIDKTYNDSRWKEWMNDDDMDNEEGVTGDETARQQLFRLKGDVNDEFKDCNDMHMGLIFYGWKKVDCKPTQTHIDALKEIGVLTEI